MFLMVSILSSVENVKVIYDKKADVLAIIFNKRSKNADFIEPTPGLLIWFDEKGNIRMIEILRASRFIPTLKLVESVKEW